MKDDPLPEEHQIARYCGGGSLTPRGEVTGASFKRKPNDEYLSVNWLEHLGLNSRQDEISEVRRILSMKLNVGSTARIAVLNVGDTKRHVLANSSDGRELRMLHRPDEPSDFIDPSHSGIFDTVPDEELIVELIAQTVRETYPAKDTAG